MPVALCLFASTPDILSLGFIVRVLTGSIEELAARAIEWGYDGIEFMPDPERVPEPAAMERALNAAGAVLPVVNSGRMGVQQMALLDADAAVRRRSIEAFKHMLDFAGVFHARVGLGIARGKGVPGATRTQMDAMAADVFPELAAYAERAGAVVMLEPADPGVTSYINTMDEAMAWVRRIASPAFSVMFDTYELAESEPSIEHGIRAGTGEARHIHLYDPSRWPPGVLARTTLEWPRIFTLLAETGFDGSASVALAPEGDPAPAARKTAAFLRSVWGGQSAGHS
jgi:D-psicose/D-tagatose/L-ribulose 3-epimerase